MGYYHFIYHLRFFGENLYKVYTALQMYFYGIGSSNPFHDLDVIYPLPKEMMFLFEKQPSEMEVLGHSPVMIVGLVMPGETLLPKDKDVIMGLIALITIYC
jgi:hypothetical protein